MSELNEWLKERRAIHDAATEDAARVLWEHDDPEGESPNENFEDEPKWERERLKQAAQAVLESSDAHNTLPALLIAVEKVLELHQPVPEGGVGYTESGYGEIDPACGTCGTYDEYAAAWPCATVRAVQSAIEGVSDE